MLDSLVDYRVAVLRAAAAHRRLAEYHLKQCAILCANAGVCACPPGLEAGRAEADASSGPSVAGMSQQADFQFIHSDPSCCHGCVDEAGNNIEVPMTEAEVLSKIRELKAPKLDAIVEVYPALREQLGQDDRPLAVAMVGYELLMRGGARAPRRGVTAEYPVV